MTTRLKNHFCFAALFLASTLCWAQPTGHAAFAFDDSNLPVYDLSGSYEFNTPMTGAGGTPINLSLPVVIEHQMSGLLTGSGIAIMRIDNEAVGAEYRINGNVVRDRAGAIRVRMSVRANGTLVSGTERRFMVTQRYDLQLDPTLNVLVGQVRGSASIQGLGTSRLNSDNVVLPLPAGVDGSWFAVLDFLPLKTFSGYGVISIASFTSPETPQGFPTDRVVEARLTGGYNAKRGLSTVQLRGLGENRAASLTITFSGDDDLVSLRGRILGQNLRW